MNTEFDSLLKKLRSLADPEAVGAMARYGIIAKKAYGISTPVLRHIAKEIGKNHGLARKLWSTGVLDARALAALIEDPAMVTEPQMERWVNDFDNWAVCDACCGNVFDKTPFAWKKAREWSRRKEEFVKRAAFSLMAALAVHDKKADDRQFLPFLVIIKREANDDRNFVRKAVNWALRQIGKRSPALNRKAIQTAEEIKRMDSRSAKWIASDALRELMGDAVQRRLRRRKPSVEESGGT
ncbi:MAG: DNA alkylation repair protein [Bacteroidota bacterium]|jgi:3-methyladenine DNA glycosylase AlkD